MPSGTGLDSFMKKFKRAFDVGIAEQHAITFAAGLAWWIKALCSYLLYFLAKSL